MTNKINRRDFLHDSTLAGMAGLSAMALASSSTAHAQSSGGKSYRIGIIGSTGRGGYGHELDEAFEPFPNCEVVAVADDNERGRERAQKKLGLDTSFSDYRKMMDEVKPDIVCVCPNWIDQHRDMAVAAAERGVHMYMEKPFVPTLDQADEVVAAVDSSGVKFNLALWTHFSPMLLRLKQLIDDGAIGTVLEYRARGKEDGRGGSEDLWVLGIHVLDVVRYLGGQPKWCFANMTNNGKPVTKEDIVEGNEGVGPFAGNAMTAMWGMADGSTTYFGSHREMQNNMARFALQVYGSEGILEIQEGTMPPVKYLDDPTWSPGRSGAKWQDVSSAGIGIPEPLSGPEYRARHTLGIRDLLDAIENDREASCNAHVSRGVTEIILSAYESHRLNEPVALPLKTRVHPFTMPFSASPPATT